MPYIPEGADQQGRQQTGVWTPRRCDGAPEAAHAASEHTEQADGDEWLTANQLRERAANRIAAVLSAVFVVLAVVLVAKSGVWQ